MLSLELGRIGHEMFRAESIEREPLRAPSGGVWRAEESVGLSEPSRSSPYRAPPLSEYVPASVPACAEIAGSCAKFRDDVGDRGCGQPDLERIAAASLTTSSACSTRPSDRRGIPHP